VLVHVNGRLLEEGEASVSVFDRGFLFGDGVFESMRAVSGTVFRLPRHLDRLGNSAAIIGLPLPSPPAGIGGVVRDLLERNGLRDARVRVTVTRGPGRPGEYAEAPGPSTIVIAASAFRGLDPGLYAQGVAAAIPSRRQVPREALEPAIKSISRLGAVLARREARDRGAFEAILLDGEGNLTEGTASNVFLVQGGSLLTPPAPQEGLPGVTREAVIGLAREAGIAVVERRLPASALASAEEAFLTNTSWDVLPVTRVDGRAVGRGSPGRVTLRLLEGYRDLVRRECGGD
jgi:branched-chain amino acid aminotransferase